MPRLPVGCVAGGGWLWQVGWLLPAAWLLSSVQCQSLYLDAIRQRRHVLVGKGKEFFTVDTEGGDAS